MINLKKIYFNKMLSYNGIKVLFDCWTKLFNNVKTKFLEYKNKLIKIKYNRIEKLKEIKSSKYNELIQIKNKTKEKYNHYKEKIIMKFDNYYKYWWNNYDKIK